MTNGTLISVLGLGLILVLRHALDPDHLVAVSTILSESKSVRRSSLFTGRRFKFISQALQVIVGLFSLSFGLFLVWEYSAQRLIF